MSCQNSYNSEKGAATNSSDSTMISRNAGRKPSQFPVNLNERLDDNANHQRHSNEEKREDEGKNDPNAIVITNFPLPTVNNPERDDRRQHTSSVVTGVNDKERGQFARISHDDHEDDSSVDSYFEIILSERRNNLHRTSTESSNGFAKQYHPDGISQRNRGMQYREQLSSSRIQQKPPARNINIEKQRIPINGYYEDFDHDAISKRRRNEVDESLGSAPLHTFRLDEYNSQPTTIVRMNGERQNFKDTRGRRGLNSDDSYDFFNASSSPTQNKITLNDLNEDIRSPARQTYRGNRGKQVSFCEDTPVHTNRSKINVRSYNADRAFDSRSEEIRVQDFVHHSSDFQNVNRRRITDDEHNRQQDLHFNPSYLNEGRYIVISDAEGRELDRCRLSDVEDVSQFHLVKKSKASSVMTIREQHQTRSESEVVENSSIARNFRNTFAQSEVLPRNRIVLERPIVVGASSRTLRDDGSEHISSRNGNSVYNPTRGDDDNSYNCFQNTHGRNEYILKSGSDRVLDANKEVVLAKFFNENDRRAASSTDIDTGRSLSIRGTQSARVFGNRDQQISEESRVNVFDVQRHRRSPERKMSIFEVQDDRHLLAPSEARFDTSYQRNRTYGRDLTGGSYGGFNGDQSGPRQRTYNSPYSSDRNDIYQDNRKNEYNMHELSGSRYIREDNEDLAGVPGAIRSQLGNAYVGYSKDDRFDYTVGHGRLPDTESIPTHYRVENLPTLPKLGRDGYVNIPGSYNVLQQAGRQHLETTAYRNRFQEESFVDHSYPVIGFDKHSATRSSQRFNESRIFRREPDENAEFKLRAMNPDLIRIDPNHFGTRKDRTAQSIGFEHSATGGTLRKRQHQELNTESLAEENRRRQLRQLDPVRPIMRTADNANDTGAVGISLEAPRLNRIANSVASRGCNDKEEKEPRRESPPRKAASETSDKRGQDSFEIPDCSVNFSLDNDSILGFEAGSIGQESWDMTLQSLRPIEATLDILADEGSHALRDDRMKSPDFFHSETHESLENENIEHESISGSDQEYADLPQLELAEESSDHPLIMCTSPTPDTLYRAQDGSDDATSSNCPDNPDGVDCTENPDPQSDEEDEDDDDDDDDDDEDDDVLIEVHEANASNDCDASHEDSPEPENDDRIPEDELPDALETDSFMKNDVSYLNDQYFEDKPRMNNAFATESNPIFVDSPPRNGNLLRKKLPCTRQETEASSLVEGVEEGDYHSEGCSDSDSDSSSLFSTSSSSANNKEEDKRRNEDETNVTKRGGIDTSIVKSLDECAAESYEAIKAQWPTTKLMFDALEAQKCSELAQMYYDIWYPRSQSTPMRLMIMAEPHGYTDGAITGALCENPTFKKLVQDVHIGHINRVHCLSYGEPWLLGHSSVARLSKASRLRLENGARQFWRVLSVLSGAFDFAEGEDDPLDVQTLDELKCCFAHLEGTKKDDIAKRRKRIEEKLSIIAALRNRGILVVDISPVPIFVEATSPKKKSQSSSKAKQLIRISWETYGRHLVRLYKPENLLLIGERMESSIGEQNLIKVCDSVEGEYSGQWCYPRRTQDSAKHLKRFRTMGMAVTKEGTVTKISTTTDVDEDNNDDSSSGVSTVSES